MIPHNTSNDFRIYYWDTFEEDPNEATMLVATVQTLAEAVQLVNDRYAGRLNDNGADRIDIVHAGHVVESFHVG